LTDTYSSTGQPGIKLEIRDSYGGASLIPYCNNFEYWKSYWFKYREWGGDFKCIILGTNMEDDIVLENIFNGKREYWKYDGNQFAGDPYKSSSRSSVYRDYYLLDENDNEIYGHYDNRININQPQYSDGSFTSKFNKELLNSPYALNLYSTTVPFLPVVNNENFMPYPSSSKDVYDKTGQITITYKNRHHDENKLIINVRHVIRSNMANIGNSAVYNTKWDETAEIYLMGGGNGNYKLHQDEKEYLYKMEPLLDSYEKRKGKFRINKGY
jgi:hypothetical protein